MKKYLIISGLAFSAFALPACTKQVLDNARAQTNIASDQWGSTVDFERLIAGAYYGMTSYEGFRGSVGLPHAHEAFIGDDALLHDLGATGDWERDVYNRVNTRNDLSIHRNIWQGPYQSVALCNEVIGWVAKNGPFRDQYGPTWTNRLVGEAHFLRAYNYFTLVRIHAPAFGATAGNEARAIPLMTEPSKDPFPNRSRSTVKEVYDLLVSDLLTAIQLLPDGFRNGIDPIEYQDRATRDAARFLLARVYFQMKDFAKARLQADTVLNSNRYTLTEAPIEAWNKSGLNQRGREVVWQYVQYSTSQQQWKGTVQGAFMGFTSRGNNNINGGRILSASDAFTNEVGWGTSAYTITALPANRPPAVIPTANNFVLTSTDRRLAQLWRAIPAGFDPRPEYTGYTRTYLWCNKFNRWPGGNNNLTSFPLMRSAELYLTRAFIRLREGDRTGAAADLNAVRTRAGLPAVAEADVTENMIHIERRREMAFEQDRVFYLQAVGINIPPGDRSGVGALDWRSPNFGFPIPAFETNINPNAGN
jgi:hypothetical protein